MSFSASKNLAKACGAVSSVCSSVGARQERYWSIILLAL